MAKCLTHADCRVGGVVSKWLGRLDDEEALDEYQAMAFSAISASGSTRLTGRRRMPPQVLGRSRSC